MDKPKRGRPILSPSERLTERVEIRLTKDQSERLKAMGGASWIRRAIAGICSNGVTKK